MLRAQGDGATRGRITSPHNPRVVAARKLRLRKERTAAGAFLVEGVRGCGEALRSGWQVRDVFLSAGHDDLADMARSAGVPVTEIDARVARTLADTVNPQGAVAVVDIRSWDFDEIVRTRPRLVVVLAGVANPGNAGTVIRTAAAAGADAVVVPRGGVDPYGGKCVRAAAGALFHVPLVTGRPVEAAIDTLRSAGLQILAADMDGEGLYDVEPGLDRPTAWLFGSEAHGLDPDTRGRVDRFVRIPMAGDVESLNLAAAAAICLYASARAHTGAVR